jgi:CBS-domain-containing membrane protein
MSDETPVRIGFTTEETRVILNALEAYSNTLDSQEDKIDSLPHAIKLAARLARQQESGTVRNLCKRCYDFVYGPP